MQPSVTERSARISGGLLLGARLLGLPISTLGTIAMARWLGVRDFGVFAGASALAFFINCFSLGGLDQIFLRGDLAARLLTKRLVNWGVLTTIAGSVVAVVYPGMSTSQRLLAISLVLGLASTNLAASALLVPQRELLFAVRAARELIQKVAAVVPVIAVALLLRPSLTTAGAASLAGAGLALAMAVRALRKDLRDVPDVQAEGPSFSAALKAGLPFSVASAVFLLTRQVPVLSLTAVASPEAVAVLRAATTVYAAVQLIPAAINNDLLRPRLYRSEEGWPAALRESLAMNLVVGLGIGGIMALFPGLLVKVLYGHGFEGAITPLRLLGAAVPFFCLASWIDSYLAANRQNRQMVRRLLIALSVTAAACIGLAGRGPSWIAGAMVLSELVSVLSCVSLLGPLWRLLRKRDEVPAESR